MTSTITARPNVISSAQKTTLPTLMSLTTLIKLVWALALLHDVTTFPKYQSQIPNGDRVPFPCKPGQIWEGVGHLHPAGGGPRNPFGLDFADAGYNWTESLCRKDSDGDGKSNGAELGDPNCVWKAQVDPTQGVRAKHPLEGLSHPGICDPWDSPACANQSLSRGYTNQSLSGGYTNQSEWMTNVCSGLHLNCPALTETGVQNISVRIPPATPIPTKPTTYVCQIFDLNQLGLPAGQDFHLVAVQPIIDNAYMLHHIVLAGCKDDTPTTSGTFECPMMPSKNCQQLLHAWVGGLPGECYHPQNGIRIGLTGYKKFSMQLHWNNPQRVRGLTDSSGLLLHYTPHLRKYDAGLFSVGTTHFVLPPQRSEVIVNATCASGCTREGMLGPVRVTSAASHMHYTGRKMKVQVVRDNVVIQVLANDEDFKFDSPHVHLFPEPFELLPGDAVLSICQFDTSHSNRTITFGESTSQEMCYAFISFFPKQNMRISSCVDQLGVSRCDVPSHDGCTEFNTIVDAINTTAMFREARDTCKSFSPCLPECRDTILKFSEGNKCMQGNVWLHLQIQLGNTIPGREFLSFLSSCKIEVYLALNPQGNPQQKGSNA